MIGIAIWLVTQATLTFSRGGVWTIAGALAVGFVFLARDRRQFRNILFATISIGLLSYFVIYPGIDNFTGGTLTKRFQSTDLTNWDLIIRTELQMFRDNLALGVGPGVSELMRPLYNFKNADSHTEYSRLLADHGVLGLLALIILVWVALARSLRQGTPEQKGVRMMNLTWALLYMLHAGMRTVAPGMTFAMSMKDIEDNEEDENKIRDEGTEFPVSDF